MPQFAIVDTHLHIWDPTRLKYPWHASVPQLDRPFLLSDYDEHRATVLAYPVNAHDRYM